MTLHLNAIFSEVCIHLSSRESADNSKHIFCVPAVTFLSCSLFSSLTMCFQALGIFFLPHTHTHFDSLICTPGPCKHDNMISLCYESKNALVKCFGDACICFGVAAFFQCRMSYFLSSFFLMHQCIKLENDMTKWDGEKAKRVAMPATLAVLTWDRGARTMTVTVERR